jgi:hypothetical protein
VQIDPIRKAVCGAMALASILLAACGSGGSGDEGKLPTVRVTERDFKISAPKRISAGPVRMLVNNKGPVAHELAVVHKPKGHLPIGPDGIIVDEDKLEPLEVDELEPEDPGLHTLDLNLRPGRYVLICNMTGHYKGGMHTSVRVD